MDTDLEDIPFLSEEALSALREHFSMREHQRTGLNINGAETLKGNELDENWQLSQFWYDDETANELAEEALSQIHPDGKIALIGCPSLYYFIKKRGNVHLSVKLLDIDKRFETYKEDFLYYDYHNPLPPHVPKEWNQMYDFVIIDPPFLSEECFLKCALTAKYLSKNKIMVCTGVVMESFVEKILKAKRTNFVPRHTHNLGNEFSCFINYVSDRFSISDVKS